MEVLLEYNSTKIKLDISQINDWNSLIKKIKTLFSIKEEKEIEIYSQPKNAFLMETNFEEEFLKVKKDIKGILVEDVVDLAEKIKNIGIPLNQIEEADDEPNSEVKIIIALYVKTLLMAANMDAYYVIIFSCAVNAKNIIFIL